MPDDQIQVTEPKIESNSRTMVFYSNYTAISMTPDEVIFRFAQRDLDDSGKAVEVATVVVSPAHAKRTLAVLANIIRIYETNFGEIVADPLHRLTPEGRKNLGSKEPEALE